MLFPAVFLSGHQCRNSVRISAYRAALVQLMDVLCDGLGVQCHMRHSTDIPWRWRWLRTLYAWPHLWRSIHTGLILMLVSCCAYVCLCLCIARGDG